MDAILEKAVIATQCSRLMGVIKAEISRLEMSRKVARPGIHKMDSPYTKNGKRLEALRSGLRRLKGVQKVLEAENA
jgi:hypothetical protein